MISKIISTSKIFEKLGEGGMALCTKPKIPGIHTWMDRITTAVIAKGMIVNGTSS